MKFEFGFSLCLRRFKHENILRYDIVTISESDVLFFEKLVSSPNITAFLERNYLSSSSQATLFIH